MSLQRHYCDKLDEELYTATLSGGFELWMMPKKGARQTVAQLSVASGVIHQMEDRYGVGVAHMLEHLLFEKPEGEIAQRFADLGGDINASTGLEGTEYVLTCGVGIEEYVPLLFELVFDGRWKEERLAREREIIASEIGLYGDDPEWVGYYSSLSNAYGNHPIAWEIAGDHSLLETLDTGFLKRWHQTFYRPYNMAFFVAGDFEVRGLLSACETALRQYALPCSPSGMEFINPLSECPPCQDATEKWARIELPIRNAQVFIALPDLLTAGEGRSVERELALELSIDMVLGPTCDAYVALYEAGLVAGDTFAADVCMESTCGFLLISAETADPQVFTRETFGALSHSFCRADFEGDIDRAKKKMYGQLVRSFETPEGCVHLMDAARQLGASGPFDYMEALDTLTSEGVFDQWKRGVGHLGGGVALILPPRGGQYELK